MPETLVLRGGTLLDATGERPGDVVVADGVIVAVGPGLDGDRVLDCGGCVVAPGLVDLNASLGEPGQETVETIATAARAAALGGFTAVVARPDTLPMIDDAAVVTHIGHLAAGAACEVHCAATVTVGAAGERLSPMAELVEAGVRLFVDDGVGVQDARLMRRALEYAAGLGAVIGQHAEDAALAADGHLHEGEWSSRLGIAGAPAEAEELIVMRDLALARLTGGRVHFQHLSTAGSLAMVNAAKRSGLPVTVEATVHHAHLTDAACAEFDPATKFRPPLRPEGDRAAVHEALRSGLVDALVSDHTPVAATDKDVPFAEALPGAVGLQWVLGLALGPLALPVATAVGLLSWRPAAIAGLTGRHGGPIAPGGPANLCVVDPTACWALDPRAGASRSHNTPFAGATLGGRVRHTILGGEPVVIDAEAAR